MATMRAVVSGRVARSTEAARAAAPPSNEACSSPIIFTELFPGIKLLASVNRAKNQCIIELGRPMDSSGEPRRLSESPTARSGSGQEDVRQAAASVPPALLAAFRVPRVIQVIQDDEGTITTIEFITERAGTAPRDGPSRSSAPAAATARLRPTTASQSSGAQVDGSSLPPPSLDNVFVHLLIGTSTGTVMVCNALRGTILAIAQFQYHGGFGGLARDASPRNPPSRSAPSLGSGLLRPRTKRNEAVVRFVAQHRSQCAQQWNPDFTVPLHSSAASSFVGSADAAPHVTGVFVVHDGGRVVFLGRDVLDVFISVVVNRQDSQRPYLAIEWSQASTVSSYPVAGPAAHFAPMVDHVFVLRPVGHFSQNELRTVPEDTSSRDGGSGFQLVAPSKIRDAAFLFTKEARPESIDSVLKKTATTGGVADAILVCGGAQAYALYPLEARKSSFSAARAVKAVASLVSGVARSLWYGKSVADAGRLLPPIDAPAQLEKSPQDYRTALLEGDAAFSRVVVDPTMHFAAFYVEGSVTTGAGRIYVVDAQTGGVWRVLKGYRSAELAWWLTTAMGRPMLLLVVYLPQRYSVEVHSIWLHQRVAACFVPPGSTFLRPAPGSSPHAGASAGPLDSPSAVFLTPSGDIIELCVDWVSLFPGSTDALTPTGLAARVTGGGAGAKATKHGAFDTMVLHSCRSPDEFFDIAMQLTVPMLADRSTARASSPTKSSSRRDYFEQLQSYRYGLKSVCDALKRRYAPSYAEARTIRVQELSVAAATESSQAVPRGLTAAQCLNYLQLRCVVVDAYAKLLASPTLKTAENRNGSGPTATQDSEEYWRHAVDCPHTCGKQFWETAARKLTVTLGDKHPREAAIMKKGKSAWAPAAGRAHGTLSGEPDTCDAFSKARSVDEAAHSTRRPRRHLGASPAVSLSEFLSWFSYGGNRVQFRREYVKLLEDSGGQGVLDRFALLFFGASGLDGFLSRLEIGSALGLDLADLAALTLSYIAAESATNAAHFNASASIGQLRFVLGTFSNDAFLAAVKRVIFPFCHRSTGVFLTESVNRVSHALLLCCGVRLFSQESLWAERSKESFSLAVRQLLTLWDASMAAVSTQRPTADTVVGSVAGDLGASPVATPNIDGGGQGPIVLRLDYLQPASSPDTGDTLESYLLRRHVPLDVVEASQGPSPGPSSLLKTLLRRPDVAPPSARTFPFVQLVNILLVTGADSFIGAPPAASCFLTSFAWLRSQTWLTVVYDTDILRAIARCWSLADPTAARACLPALGDTPLAAPKPRGGLESQWATVRRCCVVHAAIAALQQCVRPLTEAQLPFWSTGAVPDVNLFSEIVDVAAGANWLKGSRSHRDYLTSCQCIAWTTRSLLEAVLGGADEVGRVLLIQAIASVLSEDDSFTLPVVPMAFRRRLKLLMQIIGQQPDTLIHRVSLVCSFIDTLLFFADVGSLSVGSASVGTATLALLRDLQVPWAALFGSSLRESFVLYPDASLTTPHNTPTKSASSAGGTVGGTLSAFHSVSLMEGRSQNYSRLVTASSLVRNFFSVCLVPAVTKAVVGGDASEDAAVDPRIVALAVHQDSRRVLATLCTCLGVQAELQDLPGLVLFDWCVKHLCSTQQVNQELLSLTDRSLAACVALSNLRVLLGACIKYCSARKRYYMEHKDKARYDAATEKMRTVLLPISDECKQWMQRPAPAAGDAANRRSSSSGGNGAGRLDTRARLYEVVGSAAWMPARDFAAMDRRVIHCLSLSLTDAHRVDLFQLMFLLSQLVNEGKEHLPDESRYLVTELPGIVDTFRKQL